ncbi:MAG TPA: hypothetical protein VGR28_12845 [Candidatus Thermoplasmatota archaeon]|jgi:hypothetical protein|nr:hypothetical protein [Candidatus Thermoplasmatota archaeon]
MLAARFLAAIAIVAVAGVALAQSDCRHVAGTFVNQGVPPPACTSPVLFCTHGDLSGDLEGDYDFVMQTQTPNLAGPPVTMDFTGDSTITLADGTMVAHDVGTITFRVGALSPFETHVGIYDGSGAYAGASGSLVATGGYDLVTSQGSGTYQGTTCV